MDFLERLDHLKQLKGDNNASLARNAGIPYTTIDGLYKKGWANAKLPTLEALCSYFDVTLDYLVKGKDSGTQNVPELRTVALNDEEVRLVESYREMSETQRRRFWRFLAVFEEEEQ